MCVRSILTVLDTGEKLCAALHHLLHLHTVLHTHYTQGHSLTLARTHTYTHTHTVEALPTGTEHVFMNRLLCY